MIVRLAGAGISLANLGCQSFLSPTVVIIKNFIMARHAIQLWMKIKIFGLL